MRAITVSVDCGDLLNITLPYNRHHFTEIMVVTTYEDAETIRVCEENDARVFCTREFYARGEHFNKWAALEKGLDAYGRHGLMAIMDCDVLWPRIIQLTDRQYEKGCLYSPTRYIWSDVTQPIPYEDWWDNCLKYRDFQFAGYTQIFHASDEHLPRCGYWHQVDWLHAGGADSAFQALWPACNRKRPGWSVLHLGQPGQNWCGRASMRVDGRMPAHADERKAALAAYMAHRQPGQGYANERLPAPPQ